jgi:hypothetical protein
MLNLAAADTVAGVAGAATSITYSIFGMEYLSTGPTETYKKIAQGQLGSSAGTLYTVPASTTAFIKQVNLVNVTSSAVTGIILYVGGTAATNQVTGSLTIPANGTLILNDLGIQMSDALGNDLVNNSNATDTSGLAALTAATAGINTTETAVLTATLAANTLKVGTSFRIYATGVCTSSVANASNFRVRIGTAGTSADAVAVVITPTAAASGTAIPFFADFLVTVRSIGSSGSILGSGVLTNNGVTGVSAAAAVVAQTTATVTVNTTVQNIIQISYVAAAATTTCTFHNAAITLAKL